MKPVKVTAVLASPLALSPTGLAPHLDALCEWVMSSRMRTIAESSKGRHAINLTRARGEPVDSPGMIPIPIARTMVDGLPIPHCSFGICEPESETVEHFHKSFPVGRAQQLADGERITIAATGGAYKSFRLPLRKINTSRIVWFAAIRQHEAPHEAPTDLRRILNRVTHLGKKSAHGHGAVAEWIIERQDDDWSWFADGVLMRALPLSAVPDGTVGRRRFFGAVCAPYWQRNFWREGWEPC